MFKSITAVVLAIVVAGCSYAPQIKEHVKQPSVDEAAAFLNPVADPRLFHSVYQDCWARQAEMRAEYKNGERVVVGSQAQVCAGNKTRQGGVNRQ